MTRRKVCVCGPPSDAEGIALQFAGDDKEMEVGV